VVVASVEIHTERRPVLYRSPATLSADHLIPLGRLIDLTLPDQRFADLRRIIAVEVIDGGIHQPLSSLARSGLVGERRVAYLEAPRRADITRQRNLLNQLGDVLLALLLGLRETFPADALKLVLLSDVLELPAERQPLDKAVRHRIKANANVGDVHPLAPLLRS